MGATQAFLSLAVVGGWGSSRSGLLDEESAYVGLAAHRHFDTVTYPVQVAIRKQAAIAHVTHAFQCWERKRGLTPRQDAGGGAPGMAVRVGRKVAGCSGGRCGERQDSPLEDPGL